MDARQWAPPLPPELAARLQRLTHDRQRARIDLAMGRLPPRAYTAVARRLDARLRDLEAERLAHMMRAARWPDT